MMDDDECEAVAGMIRRKNRSTKRIPAPVSIFSPQISHERKLNNEELRDLYSSPSIIRLIKSRRMRWAAM
jgi:hypothetical protein